jgi:hypothetical protein
VVGAQAKLYVKDMDKPALVMNDLKSGVQKGQVALHVLIGETYFSNFEIRTTPDAPWERRLPPMPPGTLTKWSLSPAYDALERNLERPLPPSESDALRWQEVEAEPPGFVIIYRYREAPHLRVSFQSDFSKRLEPQPGMKVVYARTRIESDSDQVKKLFIGYSDERQQVTDAGGQRTRRRMGIHLPVSGTGKLSLSFSLRGRVLISTLLAADSVLCVSAVRFSRPGNDTPLRVGFAVVHNRRAR